MKLQNFNNRAIFSAECEKIVKDIYHFSFPESERRDWESLKALAEKGEIDAYVIADGEETVGLVTVWKFGDKVTGKGHGTTWIYIEHLALGEACRGRGLGSKVIEEVKKIYGVPVILEVEPSGSTPEADARLRFYGRLGFAAHADYHYVQPPYREGLPEVELTLMSHGLDGSLSLDKVAATLHSRVYGKR